jgi:5'-3' exonuclease
MSWSPLQQLLMILPPQSSALLPTPLNKLMTDEESGLISFYPRTVQLDIAFKRYRWEAHPILPTIDRTLVQRIYQHYVEMGLV